MEGAEGASGGEEAGGEKDGGEAGGGDYAEGSEGEGEREGRGRNWVEESDFVDREVLQSCNLVC